jgi:hypothetical protein
MCGLIVGGTLTITFVEEMQTQINHSKQQQKQHESDEFNIQRIKVISQRSWLK